MLADGVSWIGELPPVLLYLLLGVGAALENIVPAVPADTFVLLGAFLSALRDSISVAWVFAATWVCNVATAMVTYRLGYRHGASFFEEGWGRRVLHPGQMERMRGFYERWGTPAIFLTRFLPGLRAVVPVFAGVSHQPFLRVLLPLATASGIWYGALVWGGVTAGRNLERVRALLGEVNVVLLAAAGAVVLALGFWWWRTRHPRESDDEGSGGDGGDRSGSSGAGD